MIIEKHHHVEPRPGPHLFLDSADPAEWERLLPTGIFHGVTTNPLLLERCGQPCSVAHLGRLTKLAREMDICEMQVQTWGRTPEAMVETGEILAGLGQHGIRFVIKVPATAAGFRAARQLRDRNHPVTLTAVYEPAQVLAAAGLGAAYAAPYLGRLNDAGRDGPAVIAAMQAVLRGTGSPTRLLVASLRSAEQVVDLAARGLDTFTFGPAVAAELVAGDLTLEAAADFQRAADAMGEKPE
jgi:transaldolase